MVTQTSEATTPGVGYISPTRSQRTPPLSWIGLFVGMILSIAIPTTFSLVLLFLNGRIDLAQLKRTQFLVYQVGIPIAQCVGYFIILAIIGHLQPRWAGVLAVTFLAAAVVAFLLRGQAQTAMATVLSLALPIQLLVIGLILVEAVLVSRTRDSIGAGTLVVTAVALLILPGKTVYIIMLMLVPSMHPANAHEVLTILFSLLPFDFLKCVLAPFLGLYLPSVFRRRWRFREAGLVSHRNAQFTEYGSAPGSRASIAHNLDDNALFWAYVLPDHTQGKKIIEEELEKRGHSQAEIETWTPDPSELAVPSAVDIPVSLTKYMKILRSRETYLWFYTNIAIWIVSLSAVLLIGSFFLPGWNSKAFTYIALGEAVILFLAVGVHFRKRALRILLLRPFGEEKMTATLRNFVCENVGGIDNLSSVLDSLFGQYSQPPVFIYRNDGRVVSKDAEPFEARRTQLMEAGLASWG